MKYWFVVVLIACFSHYAFSQETSSARTAINNPKDTSLKIIMDCSPNKVYKYLPLIILKVHQKYYVLDTLNRVNPDNVKRINISKDATVYKKYYTGIKQGVITIILKNGKYTKNFDEFKGHLKKIES